METTLSTDLLLEKKRKKEKAFKTTVKVLIFLVLFLMYAPILYLIVFSFTTSKIVGVMSDFSIAPYWTLFYTKNIYAQKIWKATLNTVLVAVASGALATILGTVGAIGMHYVKFKWLKRILDFITEIPVVNAEIVMAISLCILFVSMKWERSFVTLVIGHMVLAIPFVVLSVEPKLKQMDNSLFEAALDLGANQTQAIFKVMIPDILPGIISGFLLSITLSLDDYIITAFTKPSTGGFETISTYVEAATKKAGLPIQLRAFTTILFIIIMVTMVILSKKMKEKEAK